MRSPSICVGLWAMGDNGRGHLTLEISLHELGISSQPSVNSPCWPASWAGSVGPRLKRGPDLRTRFGLDRNGEVPSFTCIDRRQL